MAEVSRSSWRRWRRLAFALVTVQAAYIGSYAAYYRRSVAEESRYIVYAPMADVIEARGLPRQHYVLAAVYAPINEVHVEWFGGRSACRCMMFGLSK